MSSPSTKAVLGVFLVFLFGCVAGWLGASVVHFRATTKFLQRGPEAVAEVMERRLTRNLNLDSGQQQQIHQLFMENLQQRKELQKQIQPEVQALNRQTFHDITSVLRPDQLARFKENLAVFRKRLGQSAVNFTPPPAAENPGATNAGDPPSAP